MWLGSLFIIASLCEQREKSVVWENGVLVSNTEEIPTEKRTIDRILHDDVRPVETLHRKVEYLPKDHLRIKDDSWYAMDALTRLFKGQVVACFFVILSLALKIFYDNNNNNNNNNNNDSNDDNKPP